MSKEFEAKTINVIKVSILEPEQLDFDRHSELLKTAFQEVLAGTGEEDTLSPDFFRWKYAGPIAPAKIAVVTENDRYLAANSMIALNIIAAGKRIRGWQSCDTATSPTARGKGYFSQCLKALDSVIGENEVFLGFPNKNSTKGFSSAGWVDRGVLPTWARVLPWAHGIPSNKPIEIHTFDARFDQFFEQYGRQRPPMIERTTQYMNWRYFAHPVAKYRVYAFEKSGAIQGVIVLRHVKTFGRNLALILDYLALDPKIESALLRFAATWARNNNLWPTLAMTNSLHWRKALLTGYWPVPSKLLPKRQALMGKPKGKLATEIFNQGWHLQLGDWDGF